VYLPDSLAGRRVIFYRKVVKDDELLSRNVYYFVWISIMKNYAGRRHAVVTATGCRKFISSQIHLKINHAKTISII
jgi:hypothetical protein